MIGQWYNTDQTVSWTLADTGGNGNPLVAEDGEETALGVLFAFVRNQDTAWAQALNYLTRHLDEGMLMAPLATGPGEVPTPEASALPMYLELAGASHTATNHANTTQAQYEIPWLKRFIDNDTRYTQFLCPTPSTSSTISSINNTCPF